MALGAEYSINSLEVAKSYVTDEVFFLAVLARSCIMNSRGRLAMNPKRTMTLNLTEQEMRVLDEISAQKDLSKTAVLRQALRLYQLIDVRLSRGEKLFFEDEQKKEKAELMVV